MSGYPPPPPISKWDEFLWHLWCCYDCVAKEGSKGKRGSSQLKCPSTIQEVLVPQLIFIACVCMCACVCIAVFEQKLSWMSILSVSWRISRVWSGEWHPKWKVFWKSRKESNNLPQRDGDRSFHAQKQKVRQNLCRNKFLGPGEGAKLSCGNRSVLHKPPGFPLPPSLGSLSLRALWCLQSTKSRRESHPSHPLRQWSHSPLSQVLSSRPLLPSPVHLPHISIAPISEFVHFLLKILHWLQGKSRLFFLSSRLFMIIQIWPIQIWLSSHFCFPLPDG